jgi:hypothetical protein
MTKIDVKIGDTIRIVQSENLSRHYLPFDTLCEVIKLYYAEDDKIEYQVISLSPILGIPKLTQFISREDFERVL